MKSRLTSDVNLSEIAVVLSIIGIFLTFSIPALLRDNGEQRLEVASNLLSNTILQVRQKAKAGRKPYRIEYEYRENCFRVYRFEAANGWVPDSNDNYYTLPPGVYFSSQSLPSRGRVEIGADGNVSSSDRPIILKFRDKNNVRRSIRISDYGTVQECTHW